MENKKLLLEAELGRLFLELERAREFQGQAMQRVNQVRKELDDIAQGEEAKARKPVAPKA